MKYLKFSYAGIFVCFLLFAAQAFAQFEVSPDHFDDQSLTKAKSKTTTAKADSKKKTDSRPHASRQAGTAASAAHLGKPHPGRKSGSAMAGATKGTTAMRYRASSTSSAQAAPSLKAQATTVHRE